jgi:DnaJ-domain-containing protein 1
MDCYAVLGVRQDATQEEIKQAFRERALECHPDRVDDGDEAAAKEEFLRVRKAFELLSDPRKRAAYDAGDQEDVDGGDAAEVHVRRRSYQTAWREQRDGREIHVSQVILDRVNGLSADYDVVQGRISTMVSLCSVLGMLFYLYEPDAIYASDIFLIDLFLCTAIGGIYGFLLGSAWGYADLYFRDPTKQ